MKEDIFIQADNAYNQGDFQSAFKLFLKAAEAGDDSAMGRVACMYSDGEGVECNFEKSVYWDKKAVDAGNLSSMYNLGVSYRTKGDIRQAKYWFKRAFESGDGEAALQLAKLFLISGNEAEKVIYYLKESLKDSELDEESTYESKMLLSEINQTEKTVQKKA